LIISINVYQKIFTVWFVTEKLFIFLVTKKNSS